MRLVVENNPSILADKAAELVIDRTKRTPSLSIGLATGKTPLGLYQKLIQEYKAGVVSFSQASAFHLDEFCNLPFNHNGSFRSYLKRHLFAATDFKAENVHYINTDITDLEFICLSYESTIKQKGGVTVQILGIGENGHIGFNEPGSSFSSRTRVIELTRQSRINNSWAFQNLDEVPLRAITLGIETIMSSQEIILMASGKNKADIIRKAIYGPITEDVPASILQKHPNCSVYLDQEAASEI